MTNKLIPLLQGMAVNELAEKTMQAISEYTQPYAPRMMDVLDLIDKHPEHRHYIATKYVHTMRTLAKILQAKGRKVVCIVARSPNLDLPDIAQFPLMDALAVMESGMYDTLIGGIPCLIQGWRIGHPKVVISCTDDLSEQDAAQMAWRIDYSRVKPEEHDVHLGLTLSEKASKKIGFDSPPEISEG